MANVTQFTNIIFRSYRANNIKAFPRREPMRKKTWMTPK